MRKLIATAAALATLALAGVAAASDGATVVNDRSCTQTPFALVCLDVKTVTNTVVTPSGNLRYVMNGTVERTMTFGFGGTYTATAEVHNSVLMKDGEDQSRTERYWETTQSVSGSYSLTCEGGFTYHFANGMVQIGEYSYDCSVG
jgi:hypothetical protein